MTAAVQWADRDELTRTDVLLVQLVEQVGGIDPEHLAELLDVSPSAVRAVTGQPLSPRQPGLEGEPAL